MSSLWAILDLFDECPETEEEKGPSSRKIHLEYEPSSKIKVTFPVNEGSLHDSGVSQEFVPICELLPHKKVVYLYGLIVVIMFKVEPQSTHTPKTHLNIMLGCPHCDHHVWSTNAWVKHVHTHHPELPMFIEMKLEYVSPSESTGFRGNCYPTGSTNYKCSEIKYVHLVDVS